MTRVTPSTVRWNLIKFTFSGLPCDDLIKS